MPHRSNRGPVLQVCIPYFKKKVGASEANRACAYDSRSTIPCSFSSSFEKLLTLIPVPTPKDKLALHRSPWQPLLSHLVLPILNPISLPGLHTASLKYFLLTETKGELETCICQGSGVSIHHKSQWNDFHFVEIQVMPSKPNP